MTYDEAIKRIHAICSSVAYGANPTMAVVRIMDITGPLVANMEFAAEYGRQSIKAYTKVDMLPGVPKS